MAYYPSLQERMHRIVEDACATCGAGEDGGASEAMAGNGDDGIDDNENLLKGLRMLKKKGKKERKPVAEEKRSPNYEKMMGQALKYEMEADKQDDSDKKHKMLERARKIRHEIK